MSDPAVNVRAAFRDVSLALMDWTDVTRKLRPEVKYPPSTWRIAPDAELTPREYRRLELLHTSWCIHCGARMDGNHAPLCPNRKVYRPYDPQGEVEPFDIDKDWEENN